MFLILNDLQENPFSSVRQIWCSVYLETIFTQKLPKNITNNNRKKHIELNM